jgi:hypothetical protein
LTISKQQQQRQRQRQQQQQQQQQQPHENSPHLNNKNILPIFLFLKLITMIQWQQQQ